MKKAVAKKWVKALRSGKYRQTNGRLYDGHGYCCLGVLCRVMKFKFKKENKFGERVVATKNGDLDNWAVLPESVMKKAGMRTVNGEFGDASLVWLNDHGSSFEQIADKIEAKWEKL